MFETQPFSKQAGKALNDSNRLVKSFNELQTSLPNLAVIISPCILCRGRLRHRIAAARRQVVAHRRARPVIGAHPCKPCHSAEHSQRGVRLVAGPNIRCRIKARHEHDRRRSGPAAFKIHLAAATDVDQAGEVTLRRSSLCCRAFAVCRVVHDGTAAPGKQEGGEGEKPDNTLPCSCKGHAMFQNPGESRVNRLILYLRWR